MGGLGIKWLGDKSVIVKCAPDIFVDINAGVQVISQHPSLEKLCYPVSTVVALYTLTGNDYLSSFFHKTKAKFLTALVENVDHICTQVVFCYRGEYSCAESSSLASPGCSSVPS